MTNNDYFYDYEPRNYPDVTQIAGFDEAGRGAIAGPIVVAAVILPQGFTSDLIRDSKMLTAKQREAAYEIIINHALDYAITVVGLDIIERSNPKQASIIGMETAFRALTLHPQVCLIDFEKPNFYPFSGIMESLVQGDQKSLNIAAASILAKVTRDRIMTSYHKTYPNYNFDQHKGYFTKLHANALNTYGVLEIHRKTYLPVKKLLKQN